jgi:hypothetical protein
MAPMTIETKMPKALNIVGKSQFDIVAIRTAGRGDLNTV